MLVQVTVSLDVIVRQDLLRWLKNESETRGKGEKGQNYDI